MHAPWWLHGCFSRIPPPLNCRWWGRGQESSLHWIMSVFLTVSLGWGLPDNRCHWGRCLCVALCSLIVQYPFLNKEKLSVLISKTPAGSTQPPTLVSLFSLEPYSKPDVSARPHFTLPAGNYHSWGDLLETSLAPAGQSWNGDYKIHPGLVAHAI